ncbi:MAG: HEAT repeat domain-containing protein, partial [Treponema sp.]|nr:HEAT repeat domain-containing protein [Treponema sp.]
IETWDKLVEIVNDEEENSFVRMYAAEALGKMKKEEAVPILVKLFEEGDPNMRQYCVKGLSNFSNNDEAKSVILQGIRDEHYKVRVESIKTVAELNITEAVPFLTYRATKDAEMVVKKECFPVLAKLDTEESVDFLIKQITDEKVGDNAKLMASSALMEKGTKGEKEIINLAKETLKDDKRKKLRSELGKLFAKYSRPAYSEICASYLQSKDTTTISQGIDIYKNGRYETARVTIEKIARDKKTGANGKRARKILGISDEEVETKDDSTSEKSTDKKNTDDKSNKLQTKSDSSKAEAKPTDVNKKSELDAK